MQIIALEGEYIRQVGNDLVLLVRGKGSTMTYLPVGVLDQPPDPGSTIRLLLEIHDQEGEQAA